jgi:site-specific DNA recombinase
MAKNEVKVKQRKAIIFARVSTARQEKEGLSLREIQLPQAYDYAKKLGIDVIAEYAISETGSEYKLRVKFNDMIAFVKRRKDVTDIISFRVDRITRNFRDAVAIDELRTSYNTNIHCIDDRLVLTEDSTSNDITQWDMKVLFAKQFLNRVKEDGNNTKYRKLERGELPWGTPYGYKHHTINAQNKTVIAEDFKATVVRKVHSYYSTGSYSLETLAYTMNKELGTKFYKSSIHRILTDKFYIGIMTDKKSGKEYPHSYERLVSFDMFELNQQIIQGHNVNPRKYKGITSIYRGLMRCNHCGCTITSEKKRKIQKNGVKREYFYYHCTNAKKEHTSPIQYISEKELDGVFVSLFNTFGDIPTAEVERIKEALNSTHDAKNKFQDSQLTELNIRRSQLTARIRRTYDMLADGSITPEVYEENRQRYEEELNDVKRKIDRLDTADEEFYITASYLLRIFEYAGKIYEVAEVDEKRQIIGLVLSNLKLEDKNLDFNLKEPFATVFQLAKSSLWQGYVESNHGFRFWRPTH